MIYELFKTLETVFYMIFILVHFWHIEHQTPYQIGKNSFRKPMATRIEHSQEVVPKYRNLAIIANDKYNSE